MTIVYTLVSLCNEHTFKILWKSFISLSLSHACNSRFREVCIILFSDFTFACFIILIKYICSGMDFYCGTIYTYIILLQWSVKVKHFSMKIYSTVDGPRKTFHFTEYFVIFHCMLNLINFCGKRKQENLFKLHIYIHFNKMILVCFNS